MTTPIGTVTVTDYDGTGTWIVALSGEHDISTTMLLEQATASLSTSCTRAVVDFTDATFIGSSVVNWLQRARATRSAGEQVVDVVEGPADGFASRLVDLAGIRATFSCFRTRRDAFGGLVSEGSRGDGR
jgi:anti-anti-sigma regulatory factor